MIRRARTSDETPCGDRRRGRLVAGAIALLACAAVPLAGWFDALCVAGAGAAAWRLVPAAAALARRCGATVLPGGRSIHARQTPLLGGIAIFLPLFAYLVFEGSATSLGLAAGCLVVTATGLLDDIRGLAPRTKIAAQVAAALLLLAGGTRAPVLEFAPLGGIATTGLEMLVVVFWIVLATNAVNLIDGLDGLATIVVGVAAVGCAALGLSPGAALVLAAACAGFLRFNLPRARIFLGDTGSLLLGFAAGALVLNGGGPVNVPFALGLLALPLGDVAIAALRRWLRGKPVSSADRGHVHHLLLALWARPGRVLAALAAFTTLQALIAVLKPDLFGLLAIAGLWTAAGAYLVATRRPAWRRILLHRRSFRRLHLVRRFAEDSLRLAESRGDVTEVLERVADDFELVGLRVRDLRVDRGRPSGGILVEEHVDCGATTAMWSAVFTPLDPVLAEEKRTVLCDLLRAADHRLGVVGLAAPARAPEADRAPVADRGVRPLGGRPAGQVHYVVEDRARLERVSGLVRETRRRGTLEPVVIHTGRRDELGLSDAQLRELDLERPDVDLDIESGDGIVPMSRVMERYHALLDARRPAVVVVGDSSAAAACALIAKQLAIPVAHLSGATEPPDARPLARSMADLILGSARRGPADGRQLRFVDDPETAARIVPALEALLPAPNPGT